MSNKKPKQLANPNFDELIDACHVYIDHLADKDSLSDDDEAHEVFMAAITAVFGDNAWKWIEKRQDKMNGRDNRIDPIEFAESLRSRIQ